MDHRPDDPLNDSALEREIEAVLAVEPSAEFLARVRTHIAKQPSRSAWRVLPRLWSVEPLFALGVLGIVLLIVIPSWLRPEPPAVVEQPVASASPAQQPRVATEPVRPEPDVSPDTGPAEAGHYVRSRSMERPALVSAFPEVLVSEDEQRAFAQLLTTIEEGRLPPLPAATEQANSIESSPIEIPDLMVEPLPQIARLE